VVLPAHLYVCGWLSISPSLVDPLLLHRLCSKIVRKYFMRCRPRLARLYIVYPLIFLRYFWGHFSPSPLRLNLPPVRFCSTMPSSRCIFNKGFAPFAAPISAPLTIYVWYLTIRRIASSGRGPCPPSTRQGCRQRNCSRFRERGASWRWRWPIRPTWPSDAGGSLTPSCSRLVWTGWCARDRTEWMKLLLLRVFACDGDFMLGPLRYHSLLERMLARPCVIFVVFRGRVRAMCQVSGLGGVGTSRIVRGHNHQTMEWRAEGCTLSMETLLLLRARASCYLRSRFWIWPFANEMAGQLLVV